MTVVPGQAAAVVGPAWAEPLVEGCVHDWFTRRAAAAGGALAVVGAGPGLTYAELDEQSNRLARHLCELGVGPETVVGVCLERTPMLVTGLLAVLKAGGAYLPLDPTHPDERLAFCVADAAATVLLTDAPDRRLGARHTVWLDAGGVDLSRYSGAPMEPAATPDNLAYVIYTSGSTGAPKGVMIEHRQVTRLLTVTQPLFAFGPADVWTLSASAAFDISVWEMWGALLHGGRLVVVPDDVRRSPADLRALLVRERVTVFNQTPAAFRRFIEADEDAALAEGGGERGTDLALRLVIFGGETLTPEMLRPWLARHDADRPALVNMYGITETTVHSTYRRMTSADLAAPASSLIGSPLADLTLTVAGEDGRPSAVGASGELYVGGAGVARGYLGRPALTAERFLPDPTASAPGARRYRSGDVARAVTGDYEYLGRRDHQVKIRGFRIELGEVEATLSRHPAVREVAVSVDGQEDPRLVAYWVAQPGPARAGQDRPETAPTASELRGFLLRWLPDHMVPSVFVRLDRLPLTVNGKIDRRALPAPGSARPELSTPMVTPATDLTKAVAAIWAETLGIDDVGLADDFFELGGNSMLAIRIVALVRERLGLDASLLLMFEEPTVRDFVAALDERPALADHEEERT
jgi:amino acid adenylation domain-containing protein